MKKIIFYCLFFILSYNLFGQSTTMNAGNAVSIAGPGTVAWTTPANVIGVPNGTNAIVSVSASAISHHLDASSYGFAIPGGDIIDGIEVTVGWFGTSVDNQI